MNFKKNFKRFFTLSRNAEGFTLVELIVVIAILGILAVVAVPTYTNYVESANKAVDKQNLSMMNSAFAVACVMNGVDPVTGISDVTLAGTGKTVTGADAVILVTVTRTASEGATDTADEIKNLFNQTLEGGLTFKTIEYTAIDFANGSFFAEGLGDGSTGGNGGNGGTGTSNVTVTENEDGSFTYTSGSLTVTLQPEDKTTLSGDNAFSDRGSEALLNDVAVLENLLSTGIGDEVLTAVVGTKDFEDALGGYLGLTQGTDESDEDYVGRVMTELQKTDDPQSALYSAQIMYAASKAANATDKQISDLFTGTVTSNIEVKDSEGNTDYAATMANAALAYGMYTAYVQQNNIDTSTNAGNFTNVINSQDFATYFAGQGQDDLKAYQAAMNMISDNTGNSDVTSSILANGIDGNADLEALMKEIMGS